ncbi:MAG: signal recognition particle protein [Nitrososphaerota archaeon]|nr:signal recognition particle protein [Nitrososphaerota archaeon]
MFDKIREGLQSAIKRLLDRDVVDEAAIKEFVRDIQREMIQADVNVKIVYQLSKDVENRLLAEKAKPGISIKEQAITVLYDEMSKIMGGQAQVIPPKNKMYTVLLVGIQGSGKTTFAAKLARYFTKKGYKVGLVCADVFRPGAYEQLKTMADRVPVEVFGNKGKDAVKVAREGKEYFKAKGLDIVIVDTAGRHKEEKSLLDEMKQIENGVSPDLALLVIDGTIGQQAFSQADAFAKATKVGGIVVTKLDGTAKGGGALAAAAATGAKIMFVSTGERIDDLEEFSPTRFAGRILGMGDIQGLIERVKSLETEVDSETTRRITSGKMTLDDFATQLEQMGKLGPLQKIMEMMPGLPKIEDASLKQMENNLVKWKAIMKSMTAEERKDVSLLGSSRIRRIAYGSGVTEKEVKELLNRFEQMKKMMKSAKKMRFNRDLLRQMSAGA